MALCLRSRIAANLANSWEVSLVCPLAARSFKCCMSAFLILLHSTLHACMQPLLKWRRRGRRHTRSRPAYFSGVIFSNNSIRFDSADAPSMPVDAILVAFGLGPERPAIIPGEGAVMPAMPAGDGAAILPGVGAVIGSAILVCV